MTLMNAGVSHQAIITMFGAVLANGVMRGARAGLLLLL